MIFGYSAQLFLFLLLIWEKEQKIELFKEKIKPQHNYIEMLRIWKPFILAVLLRLKE